MTGRLWLAASLMCFVVDGAAAQAPDQPARPPDSRPRVELTGRVDTGDTLFITERNGVQTRGRLQRLSPDTLALLVNKQEREWPLAAVGRVERRDPLWNGMLGGAVPAGMIGAAVVGSCCSSSERDVLLAFLAFGSVGAGLGALVDRGVPGYALIDGPPLAPRSALGASTPVSEVKDLWLRVRQGDTITIHRSGRDAVSGTFVRATPDTLVVLVEGAPRIVPSSDVQRVTRRGNRYRSGMMVGGIVFGALGMLATAGCGGTSSGCGSPMFVGAFMGSGGVLWGAAIGAAIPKHPVVLESSRQLSTRHLSPLVTPRGVGLAFSTTF